MLFWIQLIMRKKSPLGDLGVLKVTILSAQTTRFTQSAMVEMGRYLCFPGFSISSKFHRQVSHHPLQRFFSTAHPRWISSVSVLRTPPHAHPEKFHFAPLLFCRYSKSKSISRFLVLFCFEDYSEFHIQKFIFFVKRKYCKNSLRNK